MDSDRLLIKVVQLMYDTRTEGDNLSDAPTTDTGTAESVGRKKMETKSAHDKTR